MQLYGRSSSLFTRVVRIVAHAHAVPLELVVVRDMTSLDPADYGGNPALKLPTLVRGDERIFGAANICRALTALEPAEPSAQEMLDHAMSAQVALIMSTQVGKLPADSIYPTKLRAGLVGALAWLDAWTGDAPELFATQLFCLVEHLAFRATVDIAPYARLAAFAHTFGQRPSAQATRYRFD